MGPATRIKAALECKIPDLIPIMPIYDISYVMKSIGSDPRDFTVSDSKERIRYLEECFLRHEVDGYFVHVGRNDDWSKEHKVEKSEPNWIITNKATGRVRYLAPDGTYVNEEKKDVSGIGKSADIDRFFTKARSKESIQSSGRFWPLKHLSTKYQKHHFSFQISTPIAATVKACGGYAQGLMMMKEDEKLFNEIMHRAADDESKLIDPGKDAGGHSIWFTSYYTGADTISPKDYENLVFPHEYRLCKKAKENGLYVLYWFLGDLMPVLDIVRKLPIDAIVLEQGRKGYVNDPVEIRKKVGMELCLFGFAYEKDFCDFNKKALKDEMYRQVQGAGANGAFIAGTPIMPPDAVPEAVDFYINEVRNIKI